MGNLLNTLRDWFSSSITNNTSDKKSKTSKLGGFTGQPGSAFGISTGKYLGEFFVYIEEDETMMRFLSLPKMENREVPKSKFQYGIDNNVLEFQEVLPKKVREVCIEQYNKNAKKSNS
tara:strand:- start:138 stop:491 length:354 start_codon:yes stop_codon:yes gene_type:complete